MNWILDVAVVAIFVVFTAVGVYRGAVRTIVEFAGFFAALVLAVTLGNRIGEGIFEAFIRPGMLESMEQALDQILTGSIGDPMNALSDALPGYVARFFDGETLMGKMEQALQSGAVEGARVLTDHVIGPVLIMLLRVIVSILLFVVLMFVIRLLAKAADLIARLPVLKQLNKGLGGVCGAAKGLMIIFLVAAVIYGIAPFVPKNWIIGMGNIEKSVVFQWVCEINPLYHLFAPN